MKHLILAVSMALLCSCADTVMVTHKDGTTETFGGVTDFRCWPAGCANGTARSISFCVGIECMLITDFTYAEHFYYDLAGTPGPVSENKIGEVNP
jgi:hypothetical protein